MSGLNPELLALALHTARGKTASVKAGFVPSDAAAGGGAPPPPDPSAGGAPPPGDPSAGGGAPPPPPDPSMAGGPPPGGGMDPSSIAGQVSQGVAQALAASGMGGGQGGAGGAGGPGGMKAPKVDINTVATDLFQLKKMFFHDLRTRGVELPPDVLDGPNRDPKTGLPSVAPTGGSDPAQGGPQGGAGPASAISPIQPMQGAFPSGGDGGGAGGGGGGMGKMSQDGSYRVGTSISGAYVTSKAAALARMLRRRRGDDLPDSPMDKAATERIQTKARATCTALRHGLTRMGT